MRNLKLKTQTKYVRFLTKKERMEVSMWYSNEWVHMEGKQVEVKGNDSLHQKMYISNNNIVIFDISFLQYLDIIYSSDLTNIVWE